MHVHNRTGRARLHRIHRFGVLAASAALLVCAAWVGCQVTPENYKTWAMFFDGVPDPSAPTLVVDDGTGVAVATASFRHQPYAEDQCDACHKSKLKFTRRDASGCVSCHPQVPDQYAYMHGPVAANACLWCHTPHESAVAHLLRESDRKLCTRCHSASLLSTENVPEHADRSRACLDCHTGHGGPARFMLRADPIEPPAPEPAPKEQ